MAIGEITNSTLLPARSNRAVNPDLLVALRNNQVNSPLAAAEQVTNGQITAQQTAETSQEQNPIEQNALFINRTLRALNPTDSEPFGSSLFTPTPFLRVAEATQMLNSLEQNALFINEALRNLSLITEPTNILLINEISPELEAAEITRDLDLIQEGALQINETLQDTGLVPSEQPSPAVPSAPIAEVGVLTTAAVTEPQPVPGLIAREAAPLLAATARAAAAQPVLPPLPEAAPVEGPTPLPAAVPPTEVVPTVTAPQELARPPITLRPDLTPYVLAVYEVRNPEPIPGIAGPITRDVQPLIPISMARAIGGPGIRRAWIREIGRAKQLTSGIITKVRTSQEEKAIRFTLDFVNEDMAANGLPLHLVFAKRGEDFSLDVYDCSDDEACWLTYEVPLPRKDMTRVLSNLQNETGIIVNTSS